MEAGVYNLPEDLIPGILLRLPVKSILRFKCVSKSWCCCITSEHFVQSQLDFAKNNIDELHIITENQYNYPKTFIGSCNGLCCYVYSYKDSVSFFLWNPSTKICRKLPPYLEFQRYNYKSFDALGFCFHGDDYKLFAAYNGGDKIIAKLYSLRSDSWKRVDDFPVLDRIWRNRPGKFANGKLYWIISFPLESIPYFEYFDLGTEAYGKLRLEHSSLYSYLHVFRERLCLLRLEGIATDLWVLNDQDGSEKESWKKMMSIAPQSCPGIIKQCTPLPVWMTPEGQTLIMYETSDAVGFVIYNPKTKSYRRSSIKESSSVLSVCISSLISPFPAGAR